MHILTGKDVAVRVNIALGYGVIIPRLQVVQPGFCIVVVAAVADGVDAGYVERVGYGFAACIDNGECAAPCVVDVPRKQVALGVVNLIYISGKCTANNVVCCNACRVFIAKLAITCAVMPSKPVVTHFHFFILVYSSVKTPPLNPYIFSFLYPYKDPGKLICGSKVNASTADSFSVFPFSM